ncbi:MAG: type II toxin-antitoxin system HicA family toxin [Nitrospiria bacterium]
MSKRKKLVQRFISKPKDFTWQELVTLLEGFGYREIRFGKTGGSRVRFIHPELPPISLHKPHPIPLLKRYQVEQILETLQGEGLL